MKAFQSSASPRSYEVWYTYVSGAKPVMNDAIKRLTAERVEDAGAGGVGERFERLDHDGQHRFRGNGGLGVANRFWMNGSQGARR